MIIDIEPDFQSNDFNVQIRQPSGRCQGRTFVRDINRGLIKLIGSDDANLAILREE
ncbi:MAG: hypothetical protein FWE29_02190 [Defluviitaleaceae bacterium]|nr:hypothetical protein [Defluviitaleaceae bacterium]